MDLENTQSQMRKGILEYCILQIISQGSCYSSDILDRLKQAKLLVVEGTLYPLLTRLKNGGLLSYRWEESKSGPPRKYFEITETGAAFLASLRSTWSELQFAVDHVSHIAVDHESHSKTNQALNHTETNQYQPNPTQSL
jgi:PadR family transcriptional regulator PadR